MCLCHYTPSVCSGRFVKGNSSCDSKCKSLGTIATFKCCVLLSVQYLTAPASHSLYCSKIDMLMLKVVGLLWHWKTAAKPSARHILYQTLAYCMCVCVCARVDMEKRRREVFGVAVAHFFFSFSSVFPLSLRCCQSPWGRISAAAIGRPRLSKYTF